MRTASGPAVNDSSSKKGNGVQPRATRRRGIRPITMVIAGLLLLLSLASMGAAYFGIWPPKAGNSETIAEKWNRTRTATPLAQRALGLKIDKLGAPTKDGDTVVVRLHVTNNVKASPIATGTPQAGAPAPPAEPATVKNGLINVIFYNETNGQQVVVGSGIGSVVDLAPGQSGIGAAMMAWSRNKPQCPAPPAAISRPPQSTRRSRTAFGPIRTP